MRSAARALFQARAQRARTVSRPSSTPACRPAYRRYRKRGRSRRGRRPLALQLIGTRRLLCT
eukprot:4623941-Pyramimonas_sp.AAC.1